MRISRASGLQGLAGMAEVSDLQGHNNAAAANFSAAAIPVDDCAWVSLPCDELATATDLAYQQQELYPCAVARTSVRLRATGRSDVGDSAAAGVIQSRCDSKGTNHLDTREGVPIKLVRPLLRVSKADLEDVCR